MPSLKCSGDNIIRQPEVSVIIPCYKQAEFLDECISSVVEQTFQNWECIIVDDGSPDNTEETAKKWVGSDLRIKYYKKTNEGVSIARNYGIELSTGKYILPLDADDKIGRQYMELALPYFKADGGVKIVYCKTKFFGEMKGGFHLPRYSFEKILAGNLIPNCAFFPKAEWEKTGGYDKNMVEGFEDWEFWINMLRNGGDVKRINSVQFYYRRKQESRNSGAQKNYDKLLDYIYEKHIPAYNKTIGNPIKLYNIKISKEYRLGKIILFLPRKIWKIVKKLARANF